MPGHKTHRMIDKIFLGREYEDVHRWMDEPYKYLGVKHRILRHSMLEILAKYWNDPDRLASAYLHILADYGYSNLRRRKRWR